jgi:prefoldin subunit 5
MLSKQCERYEEVIDKMEEEIKKLTHVNSKRLMQLDELQREVGRVEEVR